jgi:type III secretion protein J
MPSPRPPWLLAAFLLGGCGAEPLLHGLDERQVNQVLVALDEAGIAASRRRDDQAEGSWVVEVSGEAARARRVLAERELPRPEVPGFAAVFGKGSLVPTPGEERARLLQALSGELGRSLEAVDGVVEARVHLAIPADDPFRGGSAPVPRGSVLLKVRPGARGRVEPLAPGLRSLVAGAVAGLDPTQVAVVVAEAAPPAAPPLAAGRGLLRTLAAGVATLGAALLIAGSRRALPRSLRFPFSLPPWLRRDAGR